MESQGASAENMEEMAEYFSKRLEECQKQVICYWRFVLLSYVRTINGLVWCKQPIFPGTARLNET